MVEARWKQRWGRGVQKTRGYRSWMGSRDCDAAASHLPRVCVVASFSLITARRRAKLLVVAAHITYTYATPADVPRAQILYTVLPTISPSFHSALDLTNSPRP